MKHVVALSGGKDSTALALRLQEVEPRDYVYVCTPTGNELPEMLEHWRKLEGILGQPIQRLGNRTLMGLIVEQEALPTHAARWCTRIIKLETYYRWLASQTPATSYVGLRADEDGRAGMTFPDAAGVTMDFPMKRWGWSIADVYACLERFGVTVPARTDCAICFWQTLWEWYVLWRDHNDLFQQGVAAEQYVSEKRGKRYTLRSPDRDTWPASLRELGAEFAKGRVPERSRLLMERKQKQRSVGACRACTL